MNTRCASTLSAALLALAAPASLHGEPTGLDTAAARAAALEPVTFSVYWENDGSFVKPNHDTDRHYTNGAALSLAFQPAWADDLAAAMPFADAFGPADTGAGLTTGQLIFTPDNLRANGPIPDDRPYAGYLYFGGYWQRSNATTLDHVQVDLGLVGPSTLAEDIQKWVHTWADGAVEPNGWDHQLEDEFTYQLYLRRKWRIDLDETPARFEPHTFGVQLLPGVGVALGNVYRHVEAGATLRAGYNLPDDFGPSRLADLGDATGQVHPGWGAYGFLRATGRAVEHNLFLEGNTGETRHRVDPEPLVGELQVGVALQYRRDLWSFEIVYSQTFLTEEFEHQDGTDAYGGLTLSLTGWF